MSIIASSQNNNLLVDRNSVSLAKQNLFSAGVKGVQYCLSSIATSNPFLWSVPTFLKTGFGAVVAGLGLYSTYKRESAVHQSIPEECELSRGISHPLKSMVFNIPLIAMIGFQGIAMVYRFEPSATFDNALFFAGLVSNIPNAVRFYEVAQGALAGLTQCFKNAEASIMDRFRSSSVHVFNLGFEAFNLTSNVLISSRAADTIRDNRKRLEKHASTAFHETQSNLGLELSYARNMTDLNMPLEQRLLRDLLDESNRAILAAQTNGTLNATAPSM
ncbi:MAG: hypothetical protein JSS32_04920 [Verrucomicrobia bacterium]|nr:hypothetical protein [Verrucomicrobiota bacterium]